MRLQLQAGEAKQQQKTPTQAHRSNEIQSPVSQRMQAVWKTYIYIHILMIKRKEKTNVRIHILIIKRKERNTAKQITLVSKRLPRKLTPPWVWGCKPGLLVMRTESKSSWPVVQLYTLDYRTQEHTGRRGQTQRDRARDTTHITGQVIAQPWPLCDQRIIVVVVWVRAVENTGLCIAKFVKQKVIKIWTEKEKRKKKKLFLYLWLLLWWESNELKTKDNKICEAERRSYIYIYFFFQAVVPVFSIRI